MNSKFFGWNLDDRPARGSVPSGNPNRLAWTADSVSLAEENWHVFYNVLWLTGNVYLNKPQCFPGNLRLLVTIVVNKNS